MYSINTPIPNSNNINNNENSILPNNNSLLNTYSILNNSNSSPSDIKLLLNLLEKAEQILSIINLPDSSISKYNKLKQLTFEKLNLEFKPIEKKNIPNSTSPELNGQNQNFDQSNIENLIKLLYFQSLKKSMIIDLMQNFLVSIDRNEEQNLNGFLGSLTEIFNLSPSTINDKTVDDIKNEAKKEEEKMPSLFTQVDQIFIDTFNNINQIKNHYENEIDRLRKNYNKDLTELKNNVEKNSYLENDLFKVRKQNEENNYILDKMSLLINDSYERYKHDFNISGPDENDDIAKLEFIKKVLDKFFEDNNYFQNNVIPQIEQENMKLGNDMNLPFVRNVVNNNDVMREICNSVGSVREESDIFHKNFNDLMNYISKNIEGKVI